MPDSTTLEAPPDCEVTAEVEIDDMANAVVFVIQGRYNYRDHYNHPAHEDRLVVDEGWFVDRASAEARCVQLNARNQAYYSSAMAIKERDRATAIAIAEKKNQEAAVIRAAGMLKSDVAVPQSFAPESFTTFFSQSNHTVYEPTEIRRSDHDGIAQAVTA